MAPLVPTRRGQDLGKRSQATGVAIHPAGSCVRFAMSPRDARTAFVEAFVTAELARESVAHERAAAERA
ncbi:hypothetical protein [Arthrobacter sp. BF1]|uniref:hypothetical protein n=1 Tax=Arthrobacter sp. BF1 TaxID=2821145 RepID=UPI001C4F40EF|nr:hypothetical protein [Arthrobacter sp. BF1]